MVSLAKNTRVILRNVLAQLPEDPASIAGFFQEHGIRGYLKEANACPVAQFLELKLPEYEPEVNDAGTIALYYEGVPAVQVVMSTPLRDFVQYFDAEEYPELIEDE